MVNLNVNVNLSPHVVSLILSVLYLGFHPQTLMHTIIIIIIIVKKNIVSCLTVTFVAVCCKMQQYCIFV